MYGYSGYQFDDSIARVIIPFKSRSNDVLLIMTCY